MPGADVDAGNVLLATINAYTKTEILRKQVTKRYWDQQEIDLGKTIR